MWHSVSPWQPCLPFHPVSLPLCSRHAQNQKGTLLISEACGGGRVREILYEVVSSSTAPAPHCLVGAKVGPERIISRQPQTRQTAPTDATRDRHDMEGRMEPFPAAVAAQPNQRPNYGSSGARGWTRSLQSGASKCGCRLRRLGEAGRGVLDTTRAGDEIWGKRTDRRRTTAVLVSCTSERLSPPEKTAMEAIKSPCGI